MKQTISVIHRTELELPIVGGRAISKTALTRLMGLSHDVLRIVYVRDKGKETSAHLVLADTLQDPRPLTTPTGQIIRNWRRSLGLNWRQVDSAFFLRSKSCYLAEIEKAPHYLALFARIMNYANTLNLDRVNPHIGDDYPFQAGIMGLNGEISSLCETYKNNPIVLLKHISGSHFQELFHQREIDTGELTSLTGLQRKVLQRVQNQEAFRTIKDRTKFLILLALLDPNPPQKITGNELKELRNKTTSKKLAKELGIGTNTLTREIYAQSQSISQATTLFVRYALRKRENKSHLWLPSHPKQKANTAQFVFTPRELTNDEISHLKKLINTKLTKEENNILEQRKAYTLAARTGIPTLASFKKSMPSSNIFHFVIRLALQTEISPPELTGEMFEKMRKTGGYKTLKSLHRVTEISYDKIREWENARDTKLDLFGRWFSYLVFNPDIIMNFSVQED